MTIRKEKFLKKFRKVCRKGLTEKEFEELLRGGVLYPELLFIAITELRPILKKRNR